MTEVYLSEESETQLKRDALDKVLLAFLTLEVARSPDPRNYLNKIRALAIGLGESGHHSDDPETNAYSVNYVASVIDKYLDQITFGADTQ